MSGQSPHWPGFDMGGRWGTWLVVRGGWQCLEVLGSAWKCLEVLVDRGSVSSIELATKRVLRASRTCDEVTDQNMQNGLHHKEKT